MQKQSEDKGENVVQIATALVDEWREARRRANYLDKANIKRAKRELGERVTANWQEEIAELAGTLLG